MRPTDTETALIDITTREALLAEVGHLRDNPRREVDKLEKIAAPLKRHAGNWLADKHCIDDAFLARLVTTLIRTRTTHAFLLKQDGFENKTGTLVALANLICASESDEWEVWDKLQDKRVQASEEWLGAVLRGLFCFHWIYPRVHGKSAAVFRLDRPRDLAGIFDRVLEHYDLLLTELQKLQGERKAHVDVSTEELTDTVARLERLRAKFPQTTTIRRRQHLSPMMMVRAGKR
ncbi:MAG TPA: hypothetical protein VL860_14865 [Planctomycetota bacterium]|nr:hypothetical protein [Planctomycetota bacterium]